MFAATPTGERQVSWRSQAGIPVRNLWTLLVYAAGLAKFLDRVDVEADDSADLPELLARLLVVVVERRLRRNLSRAHRGREDLLTRVRGRIDWLGTEAGQQLLRGRIACRFEDLTLDTPRNRLVRAALESMTARVADAELAHRCRTFARDLARLGVSAGRPPRAEIAREQIARHDADDRLMVAVARLALDLVLPGETAGGIRATRLDRDERLLRRIFEAAVVGFYRHELHGRDGWSVHAQRSLDWPAQATTVGLPALLPGMTCDIVLNRGPRRLVLDTKFTGILTARRYGGESFKSAHLTSSTLTSARRQVRGTRSPTRRRGYCCIRRWTARWTRRSPSTATGFGSPPSTLHRNLLHSGHASCRSRQSRSEAEVATADPSAYVTLRTIYPKAQLAPLPPRLSKGAG